MFRRTAQIGVVLAIAVVGAVITGLLHEDMSSSEANLGRESFKGELSPLLSEFKAFMAGRVRSVQAFSDGLSSHTVLPSVSVIARVSVLN